MMNNEISLTEASQKLFIAYAEDACNWSGTPLVGGNVGGTKEDQGNLTDLKKKGLLSTFKSDGLEWVSFTDQGIAYAKQLGITINL
jgi:hypothetical protein